MKSRSFVLYPSLLGSKTCLVWLILLWYVWKKLSCWVNLDNNLVLGGKICNAFGDFHTRSVWPMTGTLWHVPDKKKLKIEGTSKKESPSGFEHRPFTDESYSAVFSSPPRLKNSQEFSGCHATFRTIPLCAFQTSWDLRRFAWISDDPQHQRYLMQLPLLFSYIHLRSGDSRVIYYFHLIAAHRLPTFHQSSGLPSSVVLRKLCLVLYLIQPLSNQSMPTSRLSDGSAKLLETLRLLGSLCLETQHARDLNTFIWDFRFRQWEFIP